MRLAAAALLLLLASFPGAAALLPGPERPLTTPEIGDAAGYLEVRDVASHGDDFLALWSDFSAPRAGLYASIVSESGVARPLAPAPLVRGGALAHAVAIADGYLVVVSTEGGHLLFRLDRDAQVVSGPTPLDAGPGYVTALVGIGSRNLAVVSDGAMISGVLMDGNGVVLSSGIQIAKPRGPGRTTAARAGEAVAVAWSEEIEPQHAAQPPLTAVRVVRVSWDGEVGEPSELMPPTHAWVSLASASSRGGAGVTARVQAGGGNALHNFTLGLDASSIEKHPPIAISPVAGGLQVVPVSGGFLACYTDYLPGDPNPRLVSLRFGSSSSWSVPLGRVSYDGLWIETNGDSALALFSGAPIVGVALDAEIRHRKSDVRPVALSWRQQAAPVLASAGDTMLAAWVEPRYPSYATLLVQRRDAQGNAIDAEPMVVAEDVGWQPALVFTGQVWLVAWIDSATGGLDARILVRRISAEGVLLDEQPIDAGKGWAPALASNGTVVVLAKSESRSAAIHVVRFSPAGTLLDTTAITGDSPRKSDHSVATNGQEFLVTWTESYRNVSGLRLAPDGAPMDAAPIAIAHGPLSESSARVASNGTDFVVAYVQSNPPPQVDPPMENPPVTVSEVRTKRVLKSGVLADRTADQDGTLLGRGTLPQITPFGGGYAASFIEDQYPFTRLTMYVVPLDAGGTPEASPRAVVRHAEAYSEIYAIQAIGGTVHGAYSRVSHDLDGVQRIYLRSLTDQDARRRSARR